MDGICKAVQDITVPGHGISVPSYAGISETGVKELIRDIKGVCQ